MKYLRFGTAILALFLFSCSHNSERKESPLKIKATKTLKSPEISNDKQEIQILIRKALNWSESKNSINLLPVLTDSKDSICVGFDLEKLNVTLEKLKATNFFSSRFVDNYSQIILTLDKKIKNNEFEKWSVSELPTFSFANDVDPWCLCQDVPYDKPNPWDLIEVKVIKLNDEKGELYWTWGKPELNGSPDWKDFTYKFEVEKENGKWKISYLQGFDFKESTRKDGI
ncbi:MAG: hypothetical protein ACHQIM_06855 [Sphingobacteriales bacterium]